MKNRSIFSSCLRHHCMCNFVSQNLAWPWSLFTYWHTFSTLISLSTFQAVVLVADLSRCRQTWWNSMQHMLTENESKRTRKKRKVRFMNIKQTRAERRMSRGSLWVWFKRTQCPLCSLTLISNYISMHHSHR